MSTFDDKVEPADDLLERVNQWFRSGDLSEYVRLHEGQIEYRWELWMEMGRADFETLMCCCSDNIVEVDGVDVIDFDAVRADFEAAKGSEDEKRFTRRRGDAEKRKRRCLDRIHRIDREENGIPDNH